MNVNTFGMKKYVDVIAKMGADGKVMPLTIVWTDGRKFHIDRVRDVRRAASLKSGGVGDRYTIDIGGQIRFLFLDEYRWYIEEI